MLTFLELYLISFVVFFAVDLLWLGIIAKKPMDWIKSIKRLCDPKVREELGTPMREQIASRDINIGLERLVNLISNL